MKRVLILRIGALGDGVHALPLLMALRRARPETKITWAAGPALAKFLAGHPAIDEIHVVRHGARGLYEAARDLRGRFDLAIDPQGLLKSAALCALAAKRRIGAARPRERAAALLYTDRVAVPKGIHVIEENLALLRPLGIDVGLVEYGIPAEPLREELAPFLADRPLGIAPGGAWATKRWPTDRWIAFAREAVRARPVVVVWGPGEETEARAIAAAVPKARLLPPTTFKDLVAVFPRLSALVAVESGPLHLAAALGAPTLALIGPTDPVRNGARPDARVRHRALVARPHCHPCYGRTCANWICMPSLAPAAAWEETRQLLAAD